MSYHRPLLSVTLAGGLALLGCTETPSTPADTIFRGGANGGVVITMNDAQPEAEAVAVKDGRILAVGSVAEVMTYRGEATEIVDLAGTTLTPGFIDAHGHFLGVGFQATSANLLAPPDGEVSSIAELQRVLGAWMQASPGGTDEESGAGDAAWVVGFGYDDAQLAERRHPTRQELDAVSSERPILVIHQSGHLGAVNTRALELAGIAAASADPPGGVIRREADGRRPSGVVEEAALFGLLAALPPPSEELERAQIEKGQELYARYGFTTAQEGRASAQQVATLKRAAEQGRLKLDVAAYPDVVSASEALAGVGDTYSGHLRVAGGKISLDGSPQGKTAWLTEPYLVPPPGKGADYVGYPAYDEELVFAKVDEAFRNGWQLLAHVNGDAAIDQLIAAVRAATEKYGPADRRLVGIHCQTIRDDQLDAFKELGIIPSFFSMHTFYWGDWHRDETLGRERAWRISPAKSAERRGMIWTSHHDAPVALPDSMRILSSQVTRISRSGEVIGPDQRVSPLAALETITLWAAYQYFEENSKGSIEPGKLADLVVLSENPLTIEAERIVEIRVLRTIKEGKTIYRR